MATFSQQQFTQRLAEIARSQAFAKFLNQVRESRKTHQELVEAEKAVKAQNIKQQQEQANLTDQQRVTAEKVVQHGDLAPLIDINALLQKAQGSSDISADSSSLLTEEQQQGVKTFISEVASLIHGLIDQAAEAGEINQENVEAHKEAISDALGGGDINKQCELLVESIEEHLGIPVESPTFIDDLSEGSGSVVNKGVDAQIEGISEDQEAFDSQLQVESQDKQSEVESNNTERLLYTAFKGLPSVLDRRYRLKMSKNHSNVDKEEVETVSQKIKATDFSSSPFASQLAALLSTRNEYLERQQEQIKSLSEAIKDSRNQRQEFIQSLQGQVRELQRPENLMGSPDQFSGLQRLADLLGGAGLFKPAMGGGQAELTREELRKLQREQQQSAAWRTTPSPYRY